MITVSVCCNDPDNGNFDGRVAGIEIHGADVVLAYRPKSRQPKPRKRKKAKRVSS